MLLEDGADIFEVPVANIIDAKVVDDEADHDGSPFVVPEARLGCCLKVSLIPEVFVEEVGI